MSDKVTIYSNAEYDGKSADMAVGKYNQIPFGNDSLSSLKVPPGLKVTLYENGSYSGKKMICMRNTPHVGDSVNDKISSMVVEQASSVGVIAYSDAEYEGWSCELQPGQHDLGALIGNDALSSLYIPAGYKVTLYKDASLTSACTVLLADTPHLGDFNDQATWIVVEKLQPVPKMDLAQLNDLIKHVAPKCYFHPDDAFLPSSVDWFLQRATVKSKDGASRPASTGLPTGGSDDHEYWLELPTQNRPGDLGSAVVYVNAISAPYWMDLQFWFFYPYNGAGRAKLKYTDAAHDTLGTNNADLDPMGEHGGDWEHVTLRYQFGPTKLLGVYMAQHSGGVWLWPSQIKLENGVPVVYASRHGHASYPAEGENLTNSTTVSLGLVNMTFALRNDTGKGPSLDCRSHFQVVGANFLKSELQPPAWLDYARRWGPRKVYDRSWIESTISALMGGAVSKYTKWDEQATRKIMDALPDEYKGEDGPTGPKFKGSWKDGD